MRARVRLRVRVGVREKVRKRHIAIKRQNKADKTNLSDGWQKLKWKAT